MYVVIRCVDQHANTVLRWSSACLSKLRVSFLSSKSRANLFYIVLPLLNTLFECPIT